MLTDSDIDEIIERFEREKDRYAKLCVSIETECIKTLENQAVRFRTSSRVKNSTSLRKKLYRDRTKTSDASETLLFKSVETVFETMEDFAGVRILTYTQEDAAVIFSHIVKAFPNCTKEEKAKISGYRSYHCIVQLSDVEAPGKDSQNILTDRCEIQICTMLAHVFNEIEHDIFYKPPIKGITDDALLTALFKSLAALTVSGDELVKAIVQKERDFTSKANDIFDHHTLIDIKSSIENACGQKFENDNRAGDLLEFLKRFDLNKRGYLEVKRNLGNLLSKADEYNNSLSADEKFCTIDTKNWDMLFFVLVQETKVLQRFSKMNFAKRPPRYASLARRYEDFKNKKKMATSLKAV